MPDALRNQLQRRGVGRLALDLVAPKQQGLERVFQMLLGCAVGAGAVLRLLSYGPVLCRSACRSATLPQPPPAPPHPAPPHPAPPRSTTIVTDTAEQAREVAFGSAQRQKVVSLEGTIINKAGIITGRRGRGSGRGASGGDPGQRVGCRRA